VEETPRAVTLGTVLLLGIPAALGGVANAAVVAATACWLYYGAATITISGGTCTTQPQFTVNSQLLMYLQNPPCLLTAG